MEKFVSETWGLTVVRVRDHFYLIISPASATCHSGIQSLLLN